MSAYIKMVDAGAIDQRLQGFRCIAIVVDGREYEMYLREGLELARLLFFSHAHSGLVYRYEEKRNDEDERVFEDLLA